MLHLSDERMDSSPLTCRHSSDHSLKNKWLVWGREMDFIESHGEIDPHHLGQDDNYMLIVLHPLFAFPFSQM